MIPRFMRGVFGLFCPGARRGSARAAVRLSQTQQGPARAAQYAFKILTPLPAQLLRPSV